jgi:hypothetical protein
VSGGRQESRNCSQVRTGDGRRSTGSTGSGSGFHRLLSEKARAGDGSHGTGQDQVDSIVHSSLAIIGLSHPIQGVHDVGSINSLESALEFEALRLIATSDSRDHSEEVVGRRGPSG